MQHAELLSRVTAWVQEDCLLSSGVIGKETSSRRAPVPLADFVDFSSEADACSSEEDKDEEREQDRGAEAGAEEEEDDEGGTFQEKGRFTFDGSVQS